MDDLISREMALKESHKIVIEGEVFDVVQVETLLGLPSAQLEQNKGRWINIPTKAWFTELFQCSECGEKYVYQHNFCPNCGADMRGE